MGLPWEVRASDSLIVENDEPKDVHALLVEWKDCDQLSIFIPKDQDKFTLEIGTLNGWQPHDNTYNKSSQSAP